jgi:crotonobetainyl-CoA:carnitine CoA-transferase CaiB-like acyl-CoA transferase
MSQPLEPGILDGVRIVDMAGGIAGSVAALLLAEAGADTVKIERSAAPAHSNLAGARTWNRSKRRVVLDLEREGEVEKLHALLSGADVLIHEFSPAVAAPLGIDDAALAARHPHLIASSVLAWPANHPDAGRPVDELLAMARLGICDEQKAMRRDGPVLVRFPLGTWGAVYLAAAGIAARLLVRARTGQAGPAHTSLVQGALVPMGMHWSRAENPSPPLAMGMPKETGGSQATLFECADGVWIHLMKSPDSAPLMQKALAEMGDNGVAAANDTAGSAPFGYPNRGANAAAFLGRPSQDWLTDLWANDIPVQPALPFGAIYHDEQARANGYVVDLDDPEEGRITVPGLPLTTEPPCRIKSPAPPVGAHTDEVQAEWSPRPGPNRSGPAGRWPLEGVKVLDLGNYLAGPYGPMILADMGADVIKVESTAGDAMRPTAWAFAGCQRGKRGVALDLKSPQARCALEALVRWADVVHHNIRMPAARRLGIDYESLRSWNPEVVYCHTSSYGPDGPRADWPGYDQLFQAQCGWEWLGAGRGNPPMWHRFGFMDHQCALSSVVATILALYRREQTGKGQAVAASLLGAGVLTASETYVGPDGALAPYTTLDADQTRIRPGYEIIEVADGWIAVAAHTPDQADAMQAIAGTSNLAGAAAALRTWTTDQLLADLTAAGVPCERVRLAQRFPFFDDPDNQAAGMVASYRSADWGTFEQPGALWYFGDLDVRLDRAPPALGEHTIEVLTEVGLDRAEIDALLASGTARALDHPFPSP